MTTSVYYVADPMCSWCYGFAPSIDAIRRMSAAVDLRYVMGGLAPDSDQPMPDGTRTYVQQAWSTVAARTGASFNHEFWTRCEPRRSTYRACRAVLASAAQVVGGGERMFEAVQRAYYREARNPSDSATLIELAVEIGIDADRFASDLDAAATRTRLSEDLDLARELGATGFPFLALERDGERRVVQVGWDGPDATVARVRSAITG